MEISKHCETCKKYETILCTKEGYVQEMADIKPDCYTATITNQNYMTTDIREYGEYYAVEFFIGEGNRPIIKAYNEGHFNSTVVDVLDVIDFVKAHKDDIPELREALK